MDKNTELINILKAELTLLSKDILQNIYQQDLKDLYKATRHLYEKMATVMVLKNQLTAEELKQMLAPEKTVKQEEKTEIKVEKPQSVTKEENPYKKMDKISFVRKEKNQPISKSPTGNTFQSAQKPLKKISIGLNDRISFIKYLFNGDTDAYNNFIDQLNAFEAYEAALRFINQDVKPLYQNWDGLDEYEFRLLQLLELKFA